MGIISFLFNIKKERCFQPCLHLKNRIIGNNFYSLMINENVIFSSIYIWIMKLLGTTAILLIVNENDVNKYTNTNKKDKKNYNAKNAIFWVAECFVSLIRLKTLYQ